MKIINTATYTALLRAGPLSVWSNGKSIDEAVKGLCRQARNDLGASLRKDARLRFPIYLLEEGQRLYWDDRGVYVINGENVIVAHAVPVSMAAEVDPRRPLSTVRLFSGRTAFADNGVAVDRANRDGIAPMGETVPA